MKTNLLPACLALIGWGLASQGLALELALPGKAELAFDERKDKAGVLLPNGPWSEGSVQVLAAEGQMQQLVWRLASRQIDVPALAQDLTAQLQAAGFETVYACHEVRCGGFDFRFQVPTAPEPFMHVDLGDYAYVLARRGQDMASLMISRSAEAGYVQLLAISPAAQDWGARARPSAAPGNGGAAPLEESQAQPSPQPQTTPPPDSDFESLLAAGLPVVLEDLTFDPGTSDLQPGPFDTIQRLGAWLKAHPGAVVMLVGHTDVSGGMAGNIAISQARAEAARSALLAAFPDLPKAAVEAHGLGPLAPRASNLDEAGRRQNRRVEAFVVKLP